MTFEIRVPPGEGYSASPSLFQGAGKAVRAAAGQGECVTVGICFTRPLVLRLDG